MSTETSGGLPSRVSLPMRFLGGVLLALMLALALFYLLLRPPFSDVRAMAVLLSGTAVISLVAGYVAYRTGWIVRSPHLSWTLLGIYALSSVLAFLNVWIAALRMFSSQHDLVLATVLLFFAGGIAMSLGYFLSSTLTRSIQTLSHAARAIAGGRLGTRVPVVGRDEMAELAATFNEMAAQLEVAARKQSDLDALRRDLIAWAGHDLRTPLASIRAMVEALADGVVDDPKTVERYLHTTQREIRSLSLLIDDLFEMSQLEAGGLPLERQPNSLADLISDTIESFSALALQQDISLVGSADNGVDPVQIDVQMIGRVLANLVGNSLRHTPRGGSVQLHAERSGSEVRVRICDTGEGISPQDLPRVFEQFYRGEKSRSRATGGAGLGLAIARGIIEAHGGRIWADSTPGAGACFTFTLPAGKPEQG